MPKFDIAAIISAVRSRLQFAALMAILIFLAFLVLRFGPDQRTRPTCGAGLTYLAQENREGARNLFCIWNTADGCTKLQLGDWPGRRTQSAMEISRWPASSRNSRPGSRP